MFAALSRPNMMADIVTTQATSMMMDTTCVAKSEPCVPVMKRPQSYPESESEEALISL